MEDSIIEVEDAPSQEDLNNWHKELTNKILAEFETSKPEDLLESTIKEYTRILKKHDIDIKAKDSLKDNLLNHVKTFYNLLSTSTDLSDSGYVDIMQNALVILCDLELDIATHITPSDPVEYNKKIVEITERIIYMLTVYLVEDNVGVCHVLLRLRSKFQSRQWKDIMRVIYRHFLIIIPLRDKSKENFCRNHLLFRNLKAIINKKNHLKMDALLYNRFGMSPDVLSNDHKIRRILKPLTDSIIDLVDMLTQTKVREVDNYFKYIKQKHKKKDTPLSIYVDSDSEETEIGVLPILQNKKKARNGIILVDDDIKVEEDSSSPNIICLDDDSDCEVSVTSEEQEVQPNLAVPITATSFLDLIPIPDKNISTLESPPYSVETENSPSSDELSEDNNHNINEVCDLPIADVDNNVNVEIQILDQSEPHNNSPTTIEAETHPLLTTHPDIDIQPCSDPNQNEPCPPETDLDCTVEINCELNVESTDEIDLGQCVRNDKQGNEKPSDSLPNAGFNLMHGLITPPKSDRISDDVTGNGLKNVYVPNIMTIDSLFENIPLLTVTTKKGHERSQDLETDHFNSVEMELDLENLNATIGVSEDTDSAGLDVPNAMANEPVDCCEETQVVQTESENSIALVLDQHISAKLELDQQNSVEIGLDQQYLSKLGDNRVCMVGNLDSDGLDVDNNTQDNEVDRLLIPSSNNNNDDVPVKTKDNPTTLSEPTPISNRVLFTSTDKISAPLSAFSKFEQLHSELDKIACSGPIEPIVGYMNSIDELNSEDSINTFSCPSPSRPVPEDSPISPASCSDPIKPTVGYINSMEESNSADSVNTFSYASPCQPVPEDSPISPPYEKIYRKDYQNHFTNYLSLREKALLSNTDGYKTVIKKRKSTDTPKAPSTKRVRFDGLPLIENEILSEAKESMEEYKIRKDDAKLVFLKPQVPIRIETMNELKEKEELLRVRSLLYNTHNTGGGTCIRVDFKQVNRAVISPEIGHKISNIIDKSIECSRVKNIPSGYVPPANGYLSVHGLQRSNSMEQKQNFNSHQQNQTSTFSDSCNSEILNLSVSSTINTLTELDSPESEFSRSPKLLQNTDQIVQQCLIDNLDSNVEPDINIHKNISLLSNNSNFYSTPDLPAKSSEPNLVTPTDSYDKYKEDLEELLTKNELDQLFDDKNLETEISLPLKKRRVVPKVNEPVPFKEEISYPATPMISIAEIEALTSNCSKNNRSFKTAAERKEMPPIPLIYNKNSSEPTPIITDQFNINNHTYNNPTINYHMNNVPLPFINVPCTSYYSFPPFIVPFNNVPAYNPNSSQDCATIKKEEDHQPLTKTTKKQKKEKKKQYTKTKELFQQFLSDKKFFY